MINIQIGSNDMCGACNGSYMDEVTPEKYGAYVDSAIARIKAHVPNVLVNLIGTFNVSQVFTLTASDAGMAYCRPQVQNKTSGSDENECSCSKTPEGLAKMDELSAGKIESI
jgi:phospholipase B1